MSYLSYRATLALFWLLVVMDGLLFAYFVATPQSLFNRLSTFAFLLVFIVGLLAYWRGQQWPRHLIVIGVSLGVGLLSTEPFVTHEFTLSIFLVPVLALVLTNARWVIAMTVMVYACLFIRAGGHGIYAEPLVIGFVVMLTGGMALARWLTDQALARAEEQNRQIEEERANLAERVAERTRELSAVNAQLRQTNQMKDGFLASISHELRTPLNVILGSVELLQEEIYGPLEERQQRVLGTVSESGRQLLGLINDILDLAKMEAGKFDFAFDMVSVSDVCAQCVRMIRPQAERKGLSLELDIDPAVGTIWSDPQRLRQILLNLLSNAVKFTPEGGALGLCAHRRDALIDLTVWDTGIGISAAEQELLFQPFRQLDSRLARRYDGTGLGLALVAQLVALHKGMVKVESAPGKGSSFTVSLPASQPAHPAR